MGLKVDSAFLAIVIVVVVGGGVGVGKASQTLKRIRLFILVI